MLLSIEVISYRNQPPAIALAHVFDRRGGFIGRLPDCDLCLPDAERHVSRRQAEIRYRDGEYFICNVGVASVVIDDVPLAAGREQRLENGDHVAIADYLLRLRMVQEDAASKTGGSFDASSDGGGWGGGAESEFPIDWPACPPSARDVFGPNEPFALDGLLAGSAEDAEARFDIEDFDFASDIDSRYSGSAYVPPLSASEPVVVRLGASAPQTARPGGAFTARFVAYDPQYEEQVRARLLRLSPGATPRLDLQTCRWIVGTRVTVRLDARGLVVDSPEQTFQWDGRHSQVDFDVDVPADAPEATVLKFDVVIDGFEVARLRLDLEVAVRDESSSDRRIVTTEPARSAFASYSSEDRARVLDRVAAVAISAGLDVFLDCLSLRPGEEFKHRLHEEILRRDLFLLFWSGHAAASPWVDWEWRTAAARKAIEAIQLHPLESGISPPNELRHLHFGDPYMVARAGQTCADKSE